MKKPIGVGLTDTHLSQNNSVLNKSLYKQAIEYAQEYGVNRLFHAGDVFTSRKSQSLANLKTFEEILNMIAEAGMFMEAIPGNHDKVDYTSKNSYLDPYQHWPNFKLHRGYGLKVFGFRTDIGVHFVPYFEEGSLYLSYLQKAIDSCKDFHINVLFTHIAVNGVRNNDGTEVSEGIKVSSFEAFDNVFIGHYHDKSKLGANIHYIGSTHQHNYGENDDKGFILLYDDGSFDELPSTFPKYIKYYIDVEKQGLAYVDALVQAHNADDTKHNIKFTFVGPESVVKSIDQNKYKKQGYDVDVESTEYKHSLIQAQQDNFVSFTRESIEREFDAFCEVNEIEDKQYGKDRYLQPILNTNV